jgi:hypothetical protein
LPSSLTEVLPSTSVCSTSPPVSVCGTGSPPLARGFSRQCGFNPCGLGGSPRLPIPPQRDDPPDLPGGSAYMVGGSRNPRTYPPASPHRSVNGTGWYGTLNPLSIAYAFRPRLRPDSPAADQHRCGTLGHPVGGIRTPLALLMPTFALPRAPRLLPQPLPRCGGRSPTTRGEPTHPRPRRPP